MRWMVSVGGAVSRGATAPARSGAAEHWNYCHRITENDVETYLMPTAFNGGMRSRLVAALLLALTALAIAAPVASADFDPCAGCRGGKSGVCPC